MLGRSIEHPLEHCVARIWVGRGETVSGAAFLIFGNLLCTCTHVLRGTAQTLPKKARVNFPFLSEETLTAKIVKSLPVEEIGGDIAFLSIVDPLPAGAMALRMFTSHLIAGTPCDTYGFPLGFEMGIPASAIIGNRNAMGWSSLTTITSHGVTVEEGFSGAPVWDLVRQCVVGMIVAIHKNSLVSFVIPSEFIANACPAPLELSDMDTTFDNRTSEIFVRQARRLGNPDLIVDDLGTLLKKQCRGVNRKWIYLTLGRLGNERSAQLLRLWSDQETDLAALDGLRDARRMLGTY